MWTRIKNATVMAGFAVASLLTAGCYLCLGLAVIGLCVGMYEASFSLLIDAFGLYLTSSLLDGLADVIS